MLKRTHSLLIFQLFKLFSVSLILFCRNILTSIVSNGFRFDGTGYVVLSRKDTGWKPVVKSEVALRFNTYAENGLIFFAGDGNRDFLSIEMRDGKILYQFDLGGGRAVLESDMLVNDGKWHDVMIQRINKTGFMFVDNQQSRSNHYINMPMQYRKDQKFSYINFAVIHLNIQTKRPNLKVFCQKHAIGIAKNEDPEKEQSDLGLHCLPRPACPKTWDHYGKLL